MKKLLKSLQNLGVEQSTNLDLAKRIRLGNLMSIAGISVGLIVLVYTQLSDWYFNIKLVISLLVASTLIPPILNYFKKTVASRVAYLIICFPCIIYPSIVLGAAFHFQYFLFGMIGLPLMFFGIDLGKKFALWTLLLIIVFIYLQWHFIVFDPLLKVKSSNTHLISFTNDFIALLSIFNQFFWLIKENDIYVNEIKTKSNELAEKNIQLEHFAYIASHDLKEPLRTVDSFVDIIQEEYEDPSNENSNTYFIFIREALNRMSMMINGLLSYSKIGKSGNYQMVDLNNLILEIETDLHQLINQVNASLQINHLPCITCLEVEIRQLFQNLITNAIKFRKEQMTPIIEITHIEMPNYWQFCVADNGIGISPQKHQEIFQMFTKLHLVDVYEGYGIGLAFCKKIVEIHNGKIWVESLLGKGSRFYVTIHKNIKIDEKKNT